MCKTFLGLKIPANDTNDEQEDNDFLVFGDMDFIVIWLIVNHEATEGVFVHSKHLQKK